MSVSTQIPYGVTSIQFRIQYGITIPLGRKHILTHILKCNHDLKKHLRVTVQFNFQTVTQKRNIGRIATLAQREISS